MNTAGSSSSVGQGLEGFWGQDSQRAGAALRKRQGRHVQLRIVAVVMLFCVMGATLAWVFERLSPDVQFTPYGGFSSSSNASTVGEVRLMEN